MLRQLHAVLAWVFVAAIVIQVVLAGIAFGLLVLYVVQATLPQARASVPFVAALHPLNAMVLFGLAVWYAWRAWAARTKNPDDRTTA